MPAFALQSPEVDEVLLLAGEGAALEELTTAGVSTGALGVELAMVVVEVVAGGLADPLGPHLPGLGWFQRTASAKGEASSVSSRVFNVCMMSGIFCRVRFQEMKCKDSKSVVQNQFASGKMKCGEKSDEG